MPDDRAHKFFCDHCNMYPGHRSSDTCLLEDWKEKKKKLNITNFISARK